MLTNFVYFLRTPKEKKRKKDKKQAEKEQKEPDPEAALEDEEDKIHVSQCVEVFNEQIMCLLVPTVCFLFVVWLFSDFGTLGYLLT